MPIRDILELSKSEFNPVFLKPNILIKSLIDIDSDKVAAFTAADQELLENIYNTIPSYSIHSVSFGPLRFPKEMFKDIFKLYPETPLFSGPLSQQNGVVSYDLKIEEEMIDFSQEHHQLRLGDYTAFQKQDL